MALLVFLTHPPLGVTLRVKTRSPSCSPALPPASQHLDLSFWSFLWKSDPRRGHLAPLGFILLKFPFSFKALISIYYSVNVCLWNQAITALDALPHHGVSSRERGVSCTARTNKYWLNEWMSLMRTGFRKWFLKDNLILLLTELSNQTLQKQNISYD